MQIFISWSGEKSRQIGEAFRYWLPDVIQSVSPYFTPDDIAKGQRWASDIADNLHKSQFGLFCLTSENLTAPWLLFEAGAVSKDSKNGKVCPLLFGIDSTQLAGPLLQFQATPYSKEEVYKFLKSINAETQIPLTDVQLERAFERCWRELDEKIQSVLASNTQVPEQASRSLPDMVKEMLSIVRALKNSSPQLPDDDPVSHWLVYMQATLEYATDTLKISEGAEQIVVLEHLKRMQSYIKLIANLMSPKIKITKVGVSYLNQIGKILHQVEQRINKLESSIGDDIPF
jgi:hypothetical protein